MYTSATTLLAQKKYEEAIIVFEAVMSRGSEQQKQEARLALARIYLDAERYEEARDQASAYLEGAEGDQEMRVGHFLLARALAGLGMVACYSAANECITFIYGVWVEQSFALSIASLGATALGIGVAELVGEGLVGGFTDRLGKVASQPVSVAENASQNSG